MLLPSHQKCHVQVEEDAEIVLINLYSQINFCNQFPIEMLYKAQPDKAQNLFFALKINKTIFNFLQSVIQLLGEGFKCAYFFELKQREILYYLRAYYSKADLVAFFAPVLNSDTDFSSKIYGNYEKIKNIGELAELTNYSMSGFKKRFTRVFGVSPSVWLQKERSKKIYHEINCSTKTFKELSIKYDFSSQAHFNSFCKKMYGMSPGELRESTVEKVLF
jgi:AraC-like DNA-binding protein